MRRAEAKANLILKGTRYLFLKNEQNLSKQQQQKKTALELVNLNLKSFEVMRMRETFQQIYQAKTIHDFKQLLTQWYHWVSTCKPTSMVESTKTIQRIGKGF